jgi:hypothetical protein
MNMGSFFARFSKVLHIVGVAAAAVVALPALGVAGIPTGVIAAAGGVAYVAGAIGKALFSDTPAK